MFISILASEAANLAVKVLATGGIYLAGGIPLHMPGVLTGPASWSRSGGRDASLSSWNGSQFTSS
jgi:hypothetical protein